MTLRSADFESYFRIFAISCIVSQEEEYHLYLQ
jgi:hypothetical protein